MKPVALSHSQSLLGAIEDDDASSRTVWENLMNEQQSQGDLQSTMCTSEYSPVAAAIAFSVPTEAPVIGTLSSKPSVAPR